MKNSNWPHDDNQRPCSRPRRFLHRNSRSRLLSQDYNHLALQVLHGDSGGSEVGKWLQENTGNSDAGNIGGGGCSLAGGSGRHN